MSASRPRPPGARAPLPWLWAGGAALVVVLGLALMLFEREHRRHAALLASQEHALVQFATTSLARQLEDAWRLGRVKAEAALENPLEEVSGVVAFDDAARLLFPRVATGLRREPPPTDDSPAADRWRLAQAAIAASTAGLPKDTEAAVRAMLAHRRQYRLSPPDDVLPLLEVLEALHESPRTPAPELMRLVLREGLGPGLAEEGLQRAVLRGWNALPDAAALCRRVLRLSELHLVDSSGLRCEDDAAPPAWLAPPFPETLSLRCADGQCWLLRRQDTEALAVKVDVPLLVTGLSFEMRHRGLLEVADALELDAPKAQVAVGELRPRVRLPRLAAAADEDAQELWLKRVLVALTLGLGIGAAVLTSLEARRRARFVALQSDFLATMSHELRTPLTGLRVMAETLERRLEGNDAAKDYPQRMVRQLDTLSALVENVLSWSRVEHGRWTLHRTPWRPQTLGAALQEEARTLDRPVTVDARDVSAELVVDADAQLLGLLFSNLLRNATTHTQRAQASVRLTAERSATGLVLRFVDDGAGVPREEWERVFEPFERGSDAQGRRGSGLGLALCRRIAELHGGTLGIEASSPQGTTWRLELPSSGAT